jgi:signal transduction histidine kinase
MEVVPNATPRLLPLVASILYLAVLAAGVYFAVAGLCDEPPTVARMAGFVAVLGFLILLEIVEWRLPASRGLAVGLLAVRLAAFWVVGTLECSGFSRILYVLVPFLAYFSLGRRASYVLAGLVLGGLVLALSLGRPGWQHDPAQISDVLMFGIGVVLAVSMAAVAARAERLVGQVAALATATERNRLARDIHDSLGHHLTVIAVQLEKVVAFQDRDPDVARAALADARASTRDALTDVRRSVGTLRAGFGLEPALRELVSRMDSGRLAVRLDIAGDEAGFAAPALMALYRAVQEGLTNASRHAGARTVTVRVRLEEHAASLLVADDGRGFASAGSRQQDGFGLRGMDERVRLAGGSLTVDSRPGAGTRLLVTIPRPPR